VILFLDTEFTDLAVHARLLSIALVGPAHSGIEFYAEVIDMDRIDGASWFAVDSVIPQFGRVAGAACAYSVLCTRLVNFLDELFLSQAPGEGIDIAFDYHLDWHLMELAIKDAPGAHWAATGRRLQPRNVYAKSSMAPGRRAAEDYFLTQTQAAYSRHHALCDARALRLAYQASPLPGETHEPIPNRRHRRQPSQGVVQPTTG
jgi:hypothetical protein